MVDAVAEVPYGAYPTACYQHYGVDWEHLDLYLESSSSQEAYKKYLDTYIYATKDHREFIERAGGKKALERAKWNRGGLK
jgi:hypothetical protein